MRRKNTQRDTSDDRSRRIRLPSKLDAELQAAAAAQGISLNDLIVARLMTPRKPRTIRQRLMELRPLAEDPSVPTEEVVRRMEEINPYRGAQRPVDGRLAFTETDVEALLAQIEPLPGSLPF